jgi:hypothetical protein
VPAGFDLGPAHILERPFTFAKRNLVYPAAMVQKTGFEFPRFPARVSALATFAAIALSPQLGRAQQTTADWTFAVSGDSRNCGDFVMPAIASKVKAEKDTFYWHLGDFRWMSTPDEDLQSMRPADKQLTKEEYQPIAWDDFLTHQMAAFGDFPVFLGRGNHEAVKPMTREGYIQKFQSFLNRREIAAQRKADRTDAVESWYRWTESGVDFVTLDNASKDQFSDAQMSWLRGVLDRDLAADSGIKTIVVGMHESLPHSNASDHAMDDWDLGIHTGEIVYGWLFDAQAAGKHVYVITSHSHYYSPNIYKTPYWQQYTKKVLTGIIIGSAGAHRYDLPREADTESKTRIYGFLQATVHGDGTIDFKLHELSEDDLIKAKWPEAPLDKIHWCYVHNNDDDDKPKAKN